MKGVGIKHIVVIGGGTGTYTVLSGLKKFPVEALSLSAIISVSDNGGSTGRLRDEFGILPVGDFRMALAALASGSRGKNVLRELFLYRFQKGEGLEGHNFGNLFLVAMTDILGSEEKAIAFASKILRVQGQVIPVTKENVELRAQYEDGTILKGEAAIDDPGESHDGTQKINKLWLEPRAQISLEAKKAIERADLIVLGPGDFYTSLLPNVIVEGVAEALQRTGGNILYIVNLMSKYGQTHGFTAKDYTLELKRYAGRAPEHILINTALLPKKIVQNYKAQSEFLVEDNLGNDSRVIRGDFLASEVITKPSGDVVRRSLIRHDSDKLARALMTLV